MKKKDLKAIRKIVRQEVSWEIQETVSEAVGRLENKAENAAMEVKDAGDMWMERDKLLLATMEAIVVGLNKIMDGQLTLCGQMGLVNENFQSLVKTLMDHYGASEEQDVEQSVGSRGDL